MVGGHVARLECGYTGNWRAQDGSLSEKGFSPKQREPGQAFYI